MEKIYFVWLGITILAALVEAIVPALVSIWFVPGGLAALIASLLGAPLWLQIVLFLAVSALALALTRPLARKVQGQETPTTNADRTVGQTAVVTEDINNILGTGRVTVLGNSWAAQAEPPDARIVKGDTVTVKRIEGVKLIVTKNEGGK